MTIEAKPERLKETRLWELALRFGFGGACTVVAGLIAKRFGPAVGGLFLAFPAIFPSGASLIESHEKERKQKAGMRGTLRGRRLAGVDAAGAAMGCVGLAVFAVVIWKELQQHNAVPVIAAASVMWGLVSVGMWWVLRRSKAIRALGRNHDH